MTVQTRDDGFRSPAELLRRLFSAGAISGRSMTNAEEEERQAALFGYAYATAKGLVSFAVKPGEGPQRDYDALFRWRQGVRIEKVPVQLKRLPPERINADETLENIIAKAAVKCTGNDLLVAIHLDRRAHFTSTTIPKSFRIRELCLWGWAKPDQAQLMVNSYVLGDSEGQQWLVDFPPPGFRRVRRIHPS
jgi:hypothetical protein